jgi:hypothetical protein
LLPYRQEPFGHREEGSVDRQQPDLIIRRARAARGRDATPDRHDPALMARYERLLAALERTAASREHTGLATRLGRGQLHRSIRA